MAPPPARRAPAALVLILALAGPAAAAGASCGARLRRAMDACHGDMMKVRCAGLPLPTLCCTLAWGPPVCLRTASVALIP